MKVKMFEIRDTATCIPAIAIAMESDDDTEDWLLRRCGYHGWTRCILLTRADGGSSCYDPYEWPNRTMKGAHFYILEHWDSLKSGEVVDARVALGETETPVESERNSDVF